MSVFFQVLSVFLNPGILGGALFIAIIAGIAQWIIANRSPSRIKTDLSWMVNGIKQSQHLKHSGGISNYFFNIDHFVATVDDIKKLSKWYVSAIKEFTYDEQVDVLAFIEKDSGPVGAISLMTQLVVETNIPGAIVRLNKRIPATRLVGEPVKEKNVLIISDVITTGRTVEDAINAISECGGNVVGICALLNRPLEKIEISEDIEIIYGATEDELRKNGFITEKSARYEKQTI